VLLAAEVLPHHVLAPAFGYFFVAQVEGVLEVQKRLSISRIGSRGRPAVLTPAPTTCTEAPSRSDRSTGSPGRSRRWKQGAKAVSSANHGIRFASTANGWRRSIICSRRARKKSGVLIEIPQESNPGHLLLRGSLRRG